MYAVTLHQCPYFFTGGDPSLNQASVPTFMFMTAPKNADPQSSTATASVGTAPSSAGGPQEGSKQTVTSSGQKVTSSRQTVTSSGQIVTSSRKEVMKNKPEKDYIEPDLQNSDPEIENTVSQGIKLNEHNVVDPCDLGPVDFEQLIDSETNKISLPGNLIAPKPKKVVQKVTVSLDDIIERDMNQKAIEKAKLEAILKVTPRTTPKSSPGQSPHKSDLLKLPELSLSKMLNAKLSPLEKEKEKVSLEFLSLLFQKFRAGLSHAAFLTLLVGL